MRHWIRPWHSHHTLLFLKHILVYLGIPIWGMFRSCQSVGRGISTRLIVSINGWGGTYWNIRSLGNFPNFNTKSNATTNKDKITRLIIKKIEQNNQLACTIHHNCSHRNSFYGSVLLPERNVLQWMVSKNYIARGKGKYHSWMPRNQTHYVK